MGSASEGGLLLMSDGVGERRRSKRLLTAEVKVDEDDHKCYSHSLTYVSWCYCWCLCHPLSTNHHQEPGGAEYKLVGEGRGFDPYTTVSDLGI